MSAEQVVTYENSERGFQGIHPFLESLEESFPAKGFPSQARSLETVGREAKAQWSQDFPETFNLYSGILFTKESHISESPKTATH